MRACESPGRASPAGAANKKAAALRRAGDAKHRRRDRRQFSAAGEYRCHKPRWARAGLNRGRLGAYARTSPDCDGLDVRRIPR